MEVERHRTTNVPWTIIRPTWIFGPRDLGPLLARMPRRLTPLDEALSIYLAPGSGPATITIDAGRPSRRRPISAAQPRSR